jgi:hypothetical protein
MFVTGLPSVHGRTPSRFVESVKRQGSGTYHGRAFQNIGKPEHVSRETSEARVKFRAAFSPALRGLRAQTSDPFHILSTSRSIHDATIVEYSYHVTAATKTTANASH